MPSASINGGRRSGTLNSSRGRRGVAAAAESGPSSTSVLDDIEGSGDYQEPSEGEDGVAGANVSTNVRRILHELDRNPEPLSSEVSDPTLKASTAHWAPMSETVNAALAFVSDVAERRADALDQTEEGEQDARLNRLDVLYMQMLDLQHTAQIRRTALEELRARVKDNDRITDAGHEYTQRVAELETEYKSKTKRQRYGTSKKYERFKTVVWEAMHDESQPMPPINDLIGAEEGEEADDSSDEIAVFGGHAQQYKCPLTLVVMIDPMKSTVCQHAYERNAIFEYLGSATKPCPAGCVARLNKKQLVEDPELTRACRQYARRKQRRRENDRTQTGATLLD